MRCTCSGGQPNAVLRIPSGSNTRSRSAAGRGGTADPKFVNGDCAMYVQSSALIGGFTRGVKFDWGTAELPHWGPPYKKATSILGGAGWACVPCRGAVSSPGCPWPWPSPWLPSRFAPSTKLTTPAARNLMAHTTAVRAITSLR